MSVAETRQEPEVLVRRNGHLGHLVLNRPKAINALTHGMVVAIADALAEWATDESVETVLISGSGDRGLCAGGDIVGIYRDAVDGGSGSERFWADEYRLNATINAYPKPFVALMDGLVLGGGVGISAHGSHRVVTERTKLGMPETGIGFVPDVGGTWLLAHSPGETGTHLALTAAMVGGSEVIDLGLADSFIDSSQLPALITALSSTSVDAALAAATSAPPPSSLATDRAWINECYQGNDVSTIIRALQAHPSAAANTAADAILAKSPTAVSVALAALRRSRSLGSLEEALDQEFRVSVRFVEGTELAEGIRAQVIDKDRTPHWKPATIAEVTDDDVEHYFADLGPRELGLAR